MIFCLPFWRRLTCVSVCVSLLSLQSTNKDMSLVRKFFTLETSNIELWIYVDPQDNPWFKAKEVATFLKYKDPGDAIRNNVSKYNKFTWIEVVGLDHHLETPLNWQPNTIFINEPGLYQLMMRSKLPGMEKFQNWVTSDVLPSIRKTGQYSVTQNENQDALIKWQNEKIQMLTDVANANREVARMTRELLNSKDMFITAQLAIQAKDETIHQKNETLLKQAPLVIDVPSDASRLHHLEVYQRCEPDGKFCYIGIRAQKRYLSKLRPGELERIIDTQSPNAVNAFNTVKDFIPGFVKVKSNKVYCDLDKKQFLEAVNSAQLHGISNQKQFQF